MSILKINNGIDSDELRKACERNTAKNKEIKRYDEDVTYTDLDSGECYADMIEESEGKYVKYSDHKAVVADINNDFQHELGKAAEKENEDSLVIGDLKDQVQTMQNKIEELEKTKDHLCNIIDRYDSKGD